MTSTTSPFNKSVQHGRKRQAILSEAAHLFNQKGTRATTLLDIAECLGLTKTSLYYYVRTKEDLIYQCYAYSIDSWQRLMDRAAGRGRTGRDKILEVVRLYMADRLEIIHGSRADQAYLSEIPALGDEHRTEIEQKYIGLFRTLRGFVIEGIEDGSVAPIEPMPATLALMGILNWTPLWLNLIPMDDLPGVADRMCRILTEGIATSPLSRDRAICFPDTSQNDLAGFDRDAQNALKIEAFLKVGSRFFNDKGFKSTSLDEIAEALEVTKGAFYYHIDNKDDLLAGCFKRTLDLVDAMQTLAEQQATSGVERLDLAARYLFNVQNTDDGPLIRFGLLSSLTPKDYDRIYEQTTKRSDRFGTYVREGQKDGSIRDIDPFIAEQMIAGAIYDSYVFPRWQTIEEMDLTSSDFFSVLFNGLAGGGSA